MNYWNRRTLIVKLASLSLVMVLSALSAGGAEKSAPDQRPGTMLPASKKDCLLCHRSREIKSGEVLLIKPVAELCIECHPDRTAPNEHRVNIIPGKTSGKLPLTNGLVTCITCHDPHQNPYGSLLRLPERDLCVTCHPY